MSTRRILITGGAGFIGINAAIHFVRRGWEVTVLDDLSRVGAAANLAWLRARTNIAFERADVRDRAAVERVVRDHRPLDAVLHLAAQVAVTTSVQDPRSDFEINALGTLNILEAVRRLVPEAIVLNASTNKVYGSMADVPVELDGDRYRYVELAAGISEAQPLEFHSPYGCSKGAAEQYVLDHHRIYGLRTVSFRQSCIYGPHQFGVEDQGWVAWFAIAAVLGRPITIYGDGRQVRDVLHVRDLLAAYEAAIDSIEGAAGTAYNVGGGPENTFSLIELIAGLEERLRRPIRLRFDDWRPGDQRVYISDIGRIEEELGWCPTVGREWGLGQLVAWVERNRQLLLDCLGQG